MQLENVPRNAAQFSYDLLPLRQQIYGEKPARPEHFVFVQRPSGMKYKRIGLVTDVKALAAFPIRAFQRSKLKYGASCSCGGTAFPTV